MTEFNVGDRVVDPNGESGVIVVSEYDDHADHRIGMEYEKASPWRHDLGGRCKHGHGWWWRSNELRLEQPLINEDDWDLLLREVF